MDDQLTSQQKNMVEKWEKWVPPVRPSKGILELFEKNILIALKNRPDSIWGLLGCTPEIRSIAGKYQAKIVCMDKNNDAFNAYKTICSPSKYETFVCSDWLNLNMNEMFDIVIGDGAISMLPLENHAEFLKNIHKMVKPKGHILLKIHVIAPLILDNTEKVFQWYRREKSDIPIYFATRPYLNPLWLNPDTLRISNLEFQNKVQESYQKGIITEKEYMELNEVKKSKVQVQFTTKDIFEGSISNLFEIISIDYAGDYPLHTNNPVYFLRKK